MREIFVITIEEVCDYENFVTPHMAFENEKDAKERFRELTEDIKEDYAEELQDGWVIDETEKIVDVYDPENYAKDHYTARLQQVVLY